MQNAYEGLLTISGEILVHGDAKFKSDVIISGNSSTQLDNNIGGNLYVAKNAFITNNLSVNDIDVRGDIKFSGNVNFMQNYELDGLNVYGNLIQMRLLDRDLHIRHKFRPNKWI